MKIKTIIDNIKSKNKNKRLLSINTLLQAKINLETTIKETIADLIEKIQKRGSVAKTKVDLEKKEEQLIYYKLAQQEANLQKHPDGKSNFYYIYKKSNLEKKRSALEDSKKKRLSKVTQQSIDKDIVAIEKQIELISTKLTTFNTSHKIQIELVPELNLL